MIAQIIDGKKIAVTIQQELRGRIQKLKERGITPGLAAVLVGDNPASAIYVQSKTQKCRELGLFSETIRLPQETSENTLLQRLHALNADARIHGILVQLPLPKQIRERAVIETIAPEKDVDGFHPVNRGRLQMGEETFVPCTPAGVHEMILRSGFATNGQHVVILGRSQIVGLPLALLLAQKNPNANATVTICHSATKDLAGLTSRADILVAAIGRANFVTADMVRSGAVVIDVGINRVDDPSSPKGYRVVGDVDFERVGERAAAITPVPGGVGPMTIMMLMQNTVLAAERIAEVT
ncbi:MAG: bifunctional 5,10-methylene-tetrahydrofolate dehydrogenase/5,10-methylene-tetrahydrofolate cyclohydrolase [candidate division KSB1 bacterium]|nr:bifunctional 5,10-methylene-tetrahydrofolate dehydrogenase/5,10-methylene-tetrahydrofolate cyclohydrolase [candidate division KSB1 bacterium]MDZ7365724.1 bifunctional 5,10-methylene-tetrahydrofolate dehydrogenase/5,10-methylene-tetrahydrofolate cyclohydrolase [candidate division KSB1 bacterium]MDZ7403796.1 bifunctional 5,10-methylene-tetrahydrofolate dehydrogenase/5,10-methylene-tetrahydrofolate cyclohydrolase [candidate division KSB1 bacterium]